MGAGNSAGRMDRLIWAGAFLLFVITTVVGFMAWRKSERRAIEPLPVLHEVPDFSLTDQNGETITKADLRGKIWIADFFFSRCQGPCPQLGARMAELQKALARAHGVGLVSFSVDPAHDTPEVLKDYAARFGAEPGRWEFLTGDPAQVRRIVKEGFLQPLEEKPDQPLHGTMFLLVDGQGMVRGIYSLDDPELLQKILNGAGNLIREREKFDSGGKRG